MQKNDLFEFEIDNKPLFFNVITKNLKRSTFSYKKQHFLVLKKSLENLLGLQNTFLLLNTNKQIKNIASTLFNSTHNS